MAPLFVAETFTGYEVSMMRARQEHPNNNTVREFHDAGNNQDSRTRVESDPDARQCSHKLKRWNMTRSMFMINAVLILTMTAIAMPAIAQNLVVNPNFDVDTAGWDGPGVFDPHDVDSSPTSGSSTYINTSAGTAGFVFARQCIALDPADIGFDVSAWTYVASGQPAAGYSRVDLVWYTDTQCSAFLTSHSLPRSSVFDAWERSVGRVFVPHTTQSVRISAVNQKTETGEFQVSVDAVTLEPNQTMIFGDSFETGSVDAWSAVSQGPS